MPFLSIGVFFIFIALLFDFSFLKFMFFKIQFT